MDNKRINKRLSKFSSFQLDTLVVVALRLFLSLDSFAAFTGRKPWSKVELNNIRLDFLPSC